MQATLLDLLQCFHLKVKYILEHYRKQSLAVVSGTQYSLSGLYWIYSTMQKLQTNDYHATGYEGKNCEMDVDECEAQPCKNGGKCFQRSDQRHYGDLAQLGPSFSYEYASGFLCKCLSGFTGKFYYIFALARRFYLLHILFSVVLDNSMKLTMCVVVICR